MTTTSSDAFYQVVGQNNRNLLVQSKRLAPYHEDDTRINVFEPNSIKPGDRAYIKLDCKHATDREIILNDIRLQFQLDFGARSPTHKVGTVLALRGTDLIRELTVKINEDIVFTCNRRFDLSLLWEMNNHKMAGSPDVTHNAYLLTAGNIPAGRGQYLSPYTGTNIKGWSNNHDGTASSSNPSTPIPSRIFPGDERHDGLPRIIYSDSGALATPYMFPFSISLNQLIGPIFNRLHLRRIEFIQIEVVFEPWLSREDCQQFLMFEQNPTVSTADGSALAHPYSVARFVNLQIQQWRTTLLDGVSGFTLPDNRMLSWLMHRFTRREFNFDFTKGFLDVQLHDFEIRTNIVRIWWMWAPKSSHPTTKATDNAFEGLGWGAYHGYDTYFGCELLWKNDKVLDLDSTFDAQRHYIESDNKRYGFGDPFVRYARLRNPDNLLGDPNKPVLGLGNWGHDHPDGIMEVDNGIRYYCGYNVGTPPANTAPFASMNLPLGSFRYEFPIYHVDLNMNIKAGAPGAELIGGIVNDTADYVLRIKKISDQPARQTTGSRVLWVMLEYQTLVNLAANSNQFRRESQIVTKQLNPQS